MRPVLPWVRYCGLHVRAVPCSKPDGMFVTNQLINVGLVEQWCATAWGACHNRCVRMTRRGTDTKVAGLDRSGFVIFAALSSSHNAT